MIERDRDRAVVLVGDPAAPYSRGLRIARALASAGYAVEIAAVAAEGVPVAEVHGSIAIRRYAPSGAWAPMAATYRADVPRRRRGVAGMPLRVVRRLASTARRWAFWPHTVRGWWATLDRDLAPAAVYHACGSLTIAPALAARDRDRAAGRRSVVIYDAIDDVIGGNNLIGVPAPVRRLIAARERGWALAADTRTTVNDALIAPLAGRWGTAPPLVVPNWPERGLGPDQPVPNLIREWLELPASTRIVLFQGRLGPNLGLDEAAEAVLQVPSTVLCLIGFGRGYAASSERDTHPRYAGRHFTLPAVHPDELVAWTASADVALIPLPPVSANQRASTPNKFWEALAAGTPVVVGPGLTVMADLLRSHELGFVGRSHRPEDLAAAISAVLDVAPEEALARRRRIAGIAACDFGWPSAAARYLALVAAIALIDDDPPAPTTGTGRG